MNGLAKFLQKSDFQVLNLNYPSTKYSLQDLAEIIHPQIEKFSNQVSGKIHIVGYSMGGLLIRAYLKKHSLKNIGRILMIGTPNQGSEVADFVQNWWIYKKLYGYAGQQLVTNQQFLNDILSKLEELEVGIIAGNKPLDFISSRVISKPNDGKVSVESTKLAGMKEHITMPYNHTFIINKRKAWQQVLNFLRDGYFAN
jgi:esterase/lipase